MPPLLTMGCSHLRPTAALLLVLAAFGLCVLLVIHRPRRLRWQALRFTRDGIAFGDTGVGVTRTETASWSRDSAGARLWNDRMLVVLRARPGEADRLAAALQNAFGMPIRLTPRGSRLARSLAFMLAFTGSITTGVTFHAQSLVPLCVGIAACVGGVAAFLFLSSSTAVR